MNEEDEVRLKYYEENKVPKVDIHIRGRGNYQLSETLSAEKF